MRKRKKALNKKPKWVGEIDISKCLPGKVYLIYNCLKCIIERKEDEKRQGRNKLISKTKNGKSIFAPICIHKEPILIKYKKCSCGSEYWGTFLRESLTCQNCSVLASKEKETYKEYYRLNSFIIKTKEDLSDPLKWDCTHRDFCLECTYKNGAKKGIACKDCPEYKKGKI